MSFKKTFKFILILPLLFTFSCSSSKINLAQNYANESGKKLDVREYLDGDLEGWGIIQDNKGIITKKFTVKIEGSWEGKRGVVKRQFIYSDGKKDSVTWLLTANDSNNFVAIGHDIKGEGVGQQYGSAAQLVYSTMMVINGDGKEQKISVQDTTYSVDDNSLISIASLTKSGLSNKGQITMALKKVVKEAKETKEKSEPKSEKKLIKFIKKDQEDTSDELEE
ncbi:MAG: DUF3833 family protein [Proteobacteria bacterium]|nr:DUF3833 family protein [Pseudomonadota bacterium]